MALDKNFVKTFISFSALIFFPVGGVVACRGLEGLEGDEYRLDARNGLEAEQRSPSSLWLEPPLRFTEAEMRDSNRRTACAEQARSLVGDGVTSNSMSRL